MTEIKELFDMVTKQTEPDLDSWKEQEDRQRRSGRNKKLGAYAMAAVFVVLAAIAVASLRGGGDEMPATSDPTVATAITNSYLDIATGERSPVAADLPGARLSEVSPQGGSIVYNTCCGYDAIFVARLDGSSRVQVTPDDLDGYGATWIDDQTILFQGRTAGTDELGDLYVADVTTGELTMVVDLPNRSNRQAWVVASDLSPDGTTVLFHLPRGAGEALEFDLWTAPLAGGNATLLRQDAGFAAYTSDGSIVFLDHPVPFESDEIWVMGGDGSDSRRLLQGGALTWPRVSPDGTTVAYGNDGKAEMVDIATGDVTAFDEFSEEPAWYGNDMLIV